MNRLRFGALLLMRGRRFGFYLSHRVVLTVPKPGVIRAASLAEFQPAQVLVADGVAVSFFEAMTAAANCCEIFPSSFDMVKRMLALPTEMRLNDFFARMRQQYGAELVEFTVPVPQKENDEQGDKTMDETEVIKDFNNKYEEARARFGKRPNILICGYTGSGKTSLARAILGDVVPDKAIGDGRPMTMGYDCYENELVRIWDSKGLENGQAEAEFTEHTRDFVRQRQNDPDVDNHIHLVWYTIQGSGARVTDCDLNLIRNIFNPEHVIAVVTKADATRPRQREALMQALTEAGIPAERIVFTSDAESGALGCKELMLLSYRMLPEAYKDAFMEAQRIDMEARIQAIRDKSSKAKAIVTTAVTAAAAAGAIPIPLSDAAVLIPIQITMIASLAGLYGLKQEAVKQSALPFVAKLVGIFAASSLLKLIPMLGSAVNATVAGTLTAAMGMFVKSNFEEVAIAKVKGIPAPQLNFDVELFKKFYAEYKKNENK
ncbi:MAG: hypothetical protein J6866_02530 [Victivallales bacterium]|nr:hypothetical protein [Victivallales bacterium]